MKSFFTSITFWNSAIVLLLSIILNQWVIPWLTKRKRVAREKLSNFYNIAYAFIKVRDNFQWKDKQGHIHNKENCGLFSTFTDEFDKKSLDNPISNENEFMNFAAKNFIFLDKDLRSLFIEYFKQKGPKNVQHGMGCDNPALIEARKKIESKIVEQYNYYKKIADE